MPGCYIPTKNGQIWKKLEGLGQSGGGGRGSTFNCLKLAANKFPHLSANLFCNKLEEIWRDSQPEHGQCIGTKINNREELGSFLLDISEVSYETPSCELPLTSLPNEN